MGLSLFCCRQEFTDYAKKSVDRLTRSIVQTSSALEGNKWLAGAKNIYNTVQQKRSQQGQSSKPFMEWVGIQQEVERLAVGKCHCKRSCFILSFLRK